MALEPTIIPPRELPAAAEVYATSDLIVDSGVSVEKAKPSQIVNVVAPVASEAEALAGTDNVKRMSALRVKQVFDALSVGIEDAAVAAALEAILGYTTGSFETEIAGGAATPVSFPVDIVRAVVFVNGTLYDDDQYTIVDDTLTPVSAWPVGSVRIFIGGFVTSNTLDPQVQAAEDAQAAAEAAAASIQPYASRAVAIAASKAAGQLKFEVIAPDGSILRYVEDAGTSTPALTMADGTKLVPDGQCHLEHFADVGEGDDDAAAWEAAMDYLEALGGGDLHLIEGRTYAFTAITHASNVTVHVNKATVKIHPDMPKTGTWYINRDISADTTRACDRTEVIGPGTFEGYDRPFDRWLSQADGTPVTDPEADYVMGTGALASGISGVDLTAVLTGDAVTSVTVTNGGAGWNSHPTHPYVPSTVPLKFVGGDGEGAAGYATIAGGTITGVTVTQGGSGYTTAPTVTTMGGYADISLLVEPSIDRRNAGYSSTGSALNFSKVNNPRVAGIHFKGFRCRVIGDAGCLNASFTRNEFTDCGKSDGPFHLHWVQSYGTPGGGQAFYAPTVNCLIEKSVTGEGNERSFAMFNPTGGGIMRENLAEGCGESTVYMNENLNHDGGVTRLIDNTFRNGRLTDIASDLIEAGGAKGLFIEGGVLEGSSQQCLIMTGARQSKVSKVTFIDNGTALALGGGKFRPFGPYSERFGYNVGTRPIAGEALVIATQYPVDIGGLGSLSMDGVEFEDNILIETRAEHPTHFFRQTKAGAGESSQRVFIRNNDASGLPAAMLPINRSITSVWATDSEWPVFKGNIGWDDTRLGGLNPSDGQYIGLGPNGDVSGSSVFVAGRVEVSPFVPLFDFTVDEAVVYVSGAAAGSGRVVIYSSNEKGRPRTVKAQSADFSTGTTGRKASALAFTFKRGELYWIGIWSEAAVTYTAIARDSFPPIAWATTSPPVPRTALRRTVSWGGASPGAWTYAAGHLAATDVAAVFMAVSE